MNKSFIKKISFPSLFLGFLASVLPINAAEVTVQNKIHDINFRIGVEGDAGWGYMRWDSTGLYSGSLSKELSPAIILALSCCKDATHWQYITLYVTNKNNVNKRIDIPLNFLCASTSTGQIQYHSEEEAKRFGIACLPSNKILIQFSKNASGQVEVHRYRKVPGWIGGMRWQHIDGQLVATLSPADYE